MTTVARLWALQVTDMAVETLRRRLAEIDKKLGETRALLEARQKAAEDSTELAAWRDKQRSLETEVRDLTQRIRAAESHLMSGRVRNPKELEGMEANVASLKRRRSTLEDQILETMIEVEGSEETLAESQGILAEVEGAWASSQAELRQERQQRFAELQQLAGRLKQQWEAIPAQDREVYRNLRSRKGGRALALVKRGSCQGCGMGLPTSVVQQVRDGVQRGERTNCPTCGRILHSQG